jgi:hypothetical protein
MNTTANSRNLVLQRLLASLLLSKPTLKLSPNLEAFFSVTDTFSPQLELTGSSEIILPLSILITLVAYFTNPSS